MIQFTAILFLLIFSLSHFTAGMAAEADQKNIEQVTLKVEGMECKSSLYVPSKIGEFLDGISR